MNENSWQSPLQRQPRQPYRPGYSRPYGQPQPFRPRVEEGTIKSGQLPVERKLFTLQLQENPRGRYLRIREDGGGKRAGLIIPASGLGEFKRILDEMVKAAEAQPKKPKE